MVKTAGTVLALTGAEITIRDKQKTVVAYPFHDRLADGIVHKKVTEANSYRRYDVRVGDRLTLGLVLHRTSSFGYRKSNFLRASATRNVQTILA